MLLAEGVHLSAQLTSSGVRRHPKREAAKGTPTGTGSKDVAASWEQYQRFANALAGPAPAGLIVHAAGPTDEGFRIPGLPERPGASCRHTRPAANACDGPVRQASGRSGRFLRDSEAGTACGTAASKFQFDRGFRGNGDRYAPGREDLVKA